MFTVPWSVQQTLRRIQDGYAIGSQAVTPLYRNGISFIFEGDGHGIVGAEPVEYTEEDLIASGWEPEPAARIGVPQVPPAEHLHQKKERLIRSVDRRTASIISSGFSFMGLRMSASESAQIKWLGLFASRSSIEYPLTVPNIDDTDFIAIEDEGTVGVAYAALVSHIDAAVRSGTAIKQQVAAAVTLEALDAIVDDRPIP